jgi:putative peptide zinc metalloprotease protein
VAISAAGPASDLTVGGVFSLAAAFAATGTVRDVFFQLAFAAYIGAVFNLNPFLDRDGYNMLVDGLGQPGLRTRARVLIAAKLSGRPSGGGDRAVAVYGVAALVWSVVAIGFGVVFSLRYYHRLEVLVPREALWLVFGIFYALMFLPLLISLVRPLVQRRKRAGEGPEVPHVAG